MALPSVPGSNTLDTLNGLFKEVYAKDLVDLIPDGVKLLSRIPFAKKEQVLGNFYHQPVVLGQEHGVTCVHIRSSCCWSNQRRASSRYSISITFSNGLCFGISFC
jgi:hypothetical protein